jgi:hypothetical protein
MNPVCIYLNIQSNILVTLRSSPSQWIGCSDTLPLTIEIFDCLISSVPPLFPEKTHCKKARYSLYMQEQKVNPYNAS